MALFILGNESVSPTVYQIGASRALHPSKLRTLLVAGCALAALAGFAVGHPEVLQKADPELANLLRGMALIKASLVIIGLGVLLWRLRLPLTPRLAIGYLAGAWIVTGATMMVWQLTYIGTAAVVFHLGGFILLLLALHDGAPPRCKKL